MKTIIKIVQLPRFAHLADSGYENVLRNLRSRHESKFVFEDLNRFGVQNIDQLYIAAGKKHLMPDLYQIAGIAIQDNNFEQFETLVSQIGRQGLDTLTTDFSSDAKLSLLHRASTLGRLEMVSLLLQNGANANVRAGYDHGVELDQS